MVFGERLLQLTAVLKSWIQEGRIQASSFWTLAGRYNTWEDYYRDEIHADS